MLRRQTVWTFVAAGLLSIAPACGSDDSKGAQKEVSSLSGGKLPSVTESGAELASVNPARTMPDAVVEKLPTQIEPEPAAKPRGPSQEEILDRLTLEAERDPDNGRIRIKLARALIDAGKLSEALGHAEIAVEAEPASSGAWNTLGRIEMAMGDRSAAITSFERAAEASEDNSYAWNNLGFALIAEERYEEAAEALEHATSGTSPTAYMWNNLGMAYEHLDRIREARAAYRQAAEAGSDKAQANLERLEGVISLIPAE